MEFTLETEMGTDYTEQMEPTGQAHSQALSQAGRLQTANGQLSNLPKSKPCWNWTKRRLQLASLYNRTLTARGFDKLPIESPKLHAQVHGWERELCAIPDALLEAAYNEAAEKHDWDQPFRPSKIRLVWVERIRAERSQQERRRLQDTGSLCEHCHGAGVQWVWQWGDYGWQRRARGCCCEWAGNTLRHDSPLQADGARWIENSLGEFLRLEDMRGQDRKGNPRGYPPGTWPKARKESAQQMPF